MAEILVLPDHFIQDQNSPDNTHTCLAGVDLMLSPSNVALVCPGEQLALRCQTNESVILRWTITLPESNTTYTRNVPFTGDGPLPSIMHSAVDSTVVFNFSRISEPDTYPLIAELLIDNINTDLNGTEINCSVLSTSVTHTTVVNVIEGRYKYYLSYIVYSICTCL